MPKRIQLIGFNISAEKGKETEPDPTSRTGTRSIEVWHLVFTDMTGGDQFRIAFRREVRDEIVRMLTGGIVLAGGDLPKLPPNPPNHGGN